MKKIVTIILCSALVVISGCDNYDFGSGTIPQRSKFAQ